MAALRCLSYVTPPPAACVITPLRGARLGSRGRQSGMADGPTQPRVIFSLNTRCIIGVSISVCIGVLSHIICMCVTIVPLLLLPRHAMCFPSWLLSSFSVSQCRVVIIFYVSCAVHACHVM